ncbi:hypothetical protein HanRHA438_Chr03g0141721 [Helianthus annuus]|nr:hypothetical protein HanIR_Chr03g0141621 [Helianthus annuus]KAJ0775240.1 hypothetical protein HanOQP8_Chr03g0120771 [Helianthus annuus]KAJ0937396.1 hypothetical protein HanRHA438_Chr03g0141721 [Helianthus annuus]
MDEKQEVPLLYLNRGCHGWSVKQSSGLPHPPGFEPQSNPNSSAHNHSSMKFTPSLQLEHIRLPPPPNFPKKKRGRPRKSPSDDPTACTLQKKMGHPQADVYQHPDFSKLKPPSRSGGFRTGEELVNLLKSASSVLISGIKEAANANEMIELSSKAFIYFDSIGIDYMPVYKAVCSVIHRHCDKEALARQKPHYAFDTKALHLQAAFEFSEAKERYVRVNRELEDAQCDFDAITAHVKRLYEEIQKGKEKQAKLEAKVAAAKADKVTCDEAYSKAKAKMEDLAPKMSEARKEIEQFERRWKETVEGLNRAMEETSSLII